MRFIKSLKIEVPALFSAMDDHSLTNGNPRGPGKRYFLTVLERRARPRGEIDINVVTKI